MGLREKIAREIIDGLRNEIGDIDSWEIADAILAIPEIAEALARADECPRLRVDDDDI